MMLNWNRVEDKMPEPQDGYFVVMKTISRRWVVVQYYGYPGAWNAFPITHWAEMGVLPFDDSRLVCDIVRQLEEEEVGYERGG